MQVFFRLIRIINSRRHVGRTDDLPDGHGRWEQYEESAGNKTDGSSQSEPICKGFGSRLAGYYANLEIPCGLDLVTVRRAWKRPVKKYHPDIHSGDMEKRRVANELMQGLNHAYEKLVKHLER